MIVLLCNFIGEFIKVRMDMFILDFGYISEVNMVSFIIFVIFINLIDI